MQRGATCRAAGRGAPVIPLDEARLVVLSGVSPARPVECALGDALGCVAAERVAAAGSVPPFTNSQMDGYALRAADTAAGDVRLQVVGSVMAGLVGEMTVGGGEAVRIMTGAPLPAGADAVCMVERTSTEDGGSAVVVHGQVAPGEYVRRRGEDIEAGQVVIEEGTVLGPFRSRRAGEPR